MMETDWNPGKLMETSGSYWKTCTLHAGVKLGVFTAMEKEKLTAEGVAGKIHGDPRAVAMLLNALCAMGLLGKDGDVYFNTPFSGDFLSKDSPRYMGYMIMHHHHLVDSWFRLDHAVKSGKPVREPASIGDEERRESFLMGMFNSAMLLAPMVVKAVDLSGRKRLLDLGGGPGTYAIHFCLHNPGLRATVYDLPTTRPFAEKTIARFGLTDRIDFQDGDYTEQGIRGAYDAAWLSHILHAAGPEACLIIIRKAVSVLQPGALIAVHEFILDNDMASPLFPALFSLNMLLGTESGQAYSQAQIEEMLAEAGVKEIRRLPFSGPTESGIIVGRV